MWAADNAATASVLLGIAAIVTAISTAAVAHRNAEAAREDSRRVAEAAREEAEAARAAAQSGEDDSFVNRALTTMQTAQKWLKEENDSLRLVIEAQRTEIIDLHRELGGLREQLSTTHSNLSKCQRTCDEVARRLADLEAGR